MLIDFHTHILPEIDDGSSSVKESIRLLQMEAKQGVTHVIATPHFYPQHDSPARFLGRRKESELRLREEWKRHLRLPDFTVGAEVYYFSGMSDSDALLDLRIAGTDCILIEMPSPPWTNQMYEELCKIYTKQGLMPIIAHVDRYISPFKTHGIPERLEELPVFVQANASFFIRKTTCRLAMRLLKGGKIHLLGSDCHNVKGRPPNLDLAMEKIEDSLGINGLRRIHLCEKEILHF